MLGAIDHDTALAAKADLKLHLLPMRVLADASAGRDGLETHGEAVEAGAVGKERGISVPIGRHGLPIRRALARLHDNGVSSNRLGLAHGCRSLSGGAVTLPLCQ